MKKKLVLILLPVILFFIFVVKTNALESLPITVFPAIQDVEITPGGKTRIQMQVRNGSTEVINGVIKSADYVITDNIGTPRLIEDTQLAPKHSAASWIKAEQTEVAIPSNDFITVDLYITAPQEVTGCGHYAIVYFQPNVIGKRVPGKGSMAITSKVGSLINISVKNTAAPCQENMGFSKINAPKFLEYGPIKIDFNLINSGDIHLTPKGIATLINFIGGLTDQKVITDQRIFPESAKNYELSLGNKWMFGKYKINLMTSYGEKNRSVAESISVWVLPWKVMIIVILTIIILIVLAKGIINNYVKKEVVLEEEIKEEKEEIEKLKEQLRRRKD